MLGLSSKTQVYRPFERGKLLKRLPADKAVRTDARVIKSITLAHVLSSETMNFGAETPATEKIYVYKIELSEKRLPEKFASALAEYTTPRTVFEFVYRGGYLLFTIPKNGKKPYRTDWSKSEPQVKIPPTTKSMDGVYVAILSAIFQIKAREGETSADFIARFDKILHLRREEVRLQGRVDRERQPRPRFDLNAELKTLKEKLKNLQE